MMKACRLCRFSTRKASSISNRFWITYHQKFSTRLNATTTDTEKDIARILDQAERAASLWEVVWTDFYPPPTIAQATKQLQHMSDINYVAWGGYPQAERTRIAIAREEIFFTFINNSNSSDTKIPKPEQEEEEEEEEDIHSSLPPPPPGGVAALSITGNFMFDKASHRDFLGALLGTGIERSRVGDIILNGEQGAQILITPNLVDHILVNLTKVRSVPVQVSEINPATDLRVTAPKTIELKSVEASLRLDAVASAGFRTSRAKMTVAIKNGDVRLNWESAKPSAMVGQGDTISCAGKGRVQVVAIETTTKGKYVVEMVRMV